MPMFLPSGCQPSVGALALFLGLLPGAAFGDEPSFSEGDEVVARWKGSYVSAQVSAVEDGKVKLSVIVGPDPGTEGKEPPKEEVILPAADVVAAPVAEAVLQTKPGGILLAQYDRIWLPRKLVSSTEASTKVLHFARQEEEVFGFMDPPDAWRAGIEAMWEKSCDLAAVAAAEKTMIPQDLGAAVKAGDEVIYGWTLEGEEGLNFSEGKVKSAAGGRVTLIKMGTDGPQEETEEVEAALVCPIPPPDRPLVVKTGNIVLHQFRYFAHHIPWVTARVDAMCGATATLTLGEGETRTADPGTFLLLKKK